MNLPVYGVAHNLTIVSIKKTFAGQAAKVMSALWGAGQMMFNKILLVVDDEVNVHNYNEVYKAFVKHTDPLHDLHFSMGPLDVLDHSASKYAFGSKLCIDATTKYSEELAANSITVGKKVDQQKILEELKEKYSEIKGASFVGSDDNAILFISFEKSKSLHAKTLAEDFLSIDGFGSVKMIVFFDDKVNVHDLPSSVWLVTNNIDPKRDCYFVENEFNRFVAIDGTRKTLANDKFERDWPNIIVSDEETIKSIDEKWDRLNLGTFIKSPSEYYKPLIINEGAVVKK